MQVAAHQVVLIVAAGYPATGAWATVAGARHAISGQTHSLSRHRSLPRSAASPILVIRAGRRYRRIGNDDARGNAMSPPDTVGTAGASPASNAYIKESSMPALPLVPDPMDDDADLARRIAGHDEAAFECVMRRNNGALYRVARAILKNEADAEDV